MKKNQAQQKTDHHIIPRSRGGDSSRKNICRVSRKEHELYHQIFSNKTPQEIIDYLVNTFWNGDREYIKS